MCVRSVAILGSRARILIGCVLAVCPLFSAFAQSDGTGVRTNATSSSNSQSHSQTIPYLRDGSAVDASGETEKASIAGGQLSRITTPVESREFIQQFVAEKLTTWQLCLKLNEWKISWAMARRSDLTVNTVGQIHWDKPTKSAAILVLDPSDYGMPLNAMLDDMELTIIHELVHLKLTSLPHSEASRGSEEQAVNGISEALFQLDHKKR